MFLAHNHSQLEYHISIGYRNRDPEWNRLTSGNASRLLDCDQTKWVSQHTTVIPNTLGLNETVLIIEVSLL